MKSHWKAVVLKTRVLAETRVSQQRQTPNRLTVAPKHTHTHSLTQKMAKLYKTLEINPLVFNGWLIWGGEIHAVFS